MTSNNADRGITVLSDPQILHPEDELKRDKSGTDAWHIEDCGGLQSVHSDMGVIKTLKTFRWACFCAFLAGIGAMSDGYQYSLPGNLLPNPGFIEQFGVPGRGEDGATELDPLQVGAWGGKG